MLRSSGHWIFLLFKLLMYRLQQMLAMELEACLGDAYRGYLGVDMMIVRTAVGYAVHPCVEVNLRMNMGVVSRLFFDRYVCREAVGRYVIEYFPRPGDALRFHEEMAQGHPLRFCEGRIAEQPPLASPRTVQTCQLTLQGQHGLLSPPSRGLLLRGQKIFLIQTRYFPSSMP